MDKLTEEQKHFYDKDYVPLVLDGLKKSEDLRAKERIARIAKILAYTAEQGPSRTPDYTEEMMRVAMALDDNDVLVLREVERAQTAILFAHGEKINVDEINRNWREHKPQLPGISEGAQQSICAARNPLNHLVYGRVQSCPWGNHGCSGPQNAERARPFVRGCPCIVVRGNPSRPAHSQSFSSPASLILANGAVGTDLTLSNGQEGVEHSRCGP